MVGVAEERCNVSVQEASNTSSQCLYLADPFRLAILDIKIIAQASIEGIQSSRGSSSILYNNNNQHTPLSVNDSLPNSPNLQHHFNSGKASSSTNTSNAPPSSYKSVNPAHSSSSTSSTSYVNRTPRSRPRSVEIGYRAKEALMDIGRGFSYGLRNLSKSDLADANESPMPPQGKSTDDHIARKVSRSSTRSQGVTLPSATEARLPELDKGERHARQIYTLRPHSLTFGPGPSAQLANNSVGLQVTSRLEGSLPIPASESAKLQWERLGHTRLEFVTDDETHPNSISGQAGRAGVFSAIQKEELGSEASDDETDNDGASETEFATSTSAKTSSDALQLLLRVAPPFQYLRHQGSTDSVRESTSVTLKIHLRLPASPSVSRIAPNGPRMLRSGSESSGTGKESRIVFVSASSSRKLFEAVETSRLHRDGRKSTGPLSSPDAARLEGINWVSVEEAKAGSDVVNFEWNWKEMGRGSAFQKDLLGKRNVKCACAVSDRLFFFNFESRC